MGLDQNKMKAMNRPESPTKDNFTDVGLTTDELANCERFCQINGLTWSKLWDLMLQYGPTLLAIIQQLLISGNPPKVVSREPPVAKTPVQEAAEKGAEELKTPHPAHRATEHPTHRGKQ